VLQYRTGRHLESTWLQAIHVDNIGKPVLDAPKDVVYTNDRKLRSIRVMRFPLMTRSRYPGRSVRFERGMEVLQISPGLSILLTRLVSGHG
jgi:hypothetical protein